MRKRFLIISTLSISVLIGLTVGAGWKATHPASATVLDPDIVITRFAAPCKAKATWNNGRVLWLCANGDVYEAPTR